MPEMADKKTILHVMNGINLLFWIHVGVDAGGANDAGYASHVNDVSDLDDF